MENNDFANLVKTLQRLDESAQKDGDQVRGTDKAKKAGKDGKHPFQGRLVGEEAAEKIACLDCDAVSTKNAWKKNSDTCPKCKTSTKGVAESTEDYGFLSDYISEAELEEDLVTQMKRDMNDYMRDKKDEQKGPKKFSKSGTRTRKSKPKTIRSKEDPLFDAELNEAPPMPTSKQKEWSKKVKKKYKVEESIPVTAEDPLVNIEEFNVDHYGMVGHMNLSTAYKIYGDVTGRSIDEILNSVSEGRPVEFTNYDRNDNPKPMRITWSDNNAHHESNTEQMDEFVDFKALDKQIKKDNKKGAEKPFDKKKEDVKEYAMTGAVEKAAAEKAYYEIEQLIKFEKLGYQEALRKAARNHNVNPNAIAAWYRNHISGSDLDEGVVDTVKQMWNHDTDEDSRAREAKIVKKLMKGGIRRDAAIEAARALLSS